MSTRVLIIEDNPVNRELMEYLLRAHGFETLGAVDGLMGLDMARRERPDLILCDIQMPGIDGLEFARRLKADATLNHTPLIAVTASAMVGDRDRILRTGFDGYVAKPIEPKDFVPTISAYLPGTHPEPEPTRPADFATGAARGPAPDHLEDAILVVDDTPQNLTLKRDLLTPCGYRVYTASTQADAWALAQQHRPALIISDVGMAGGSGFDFIRRIKADPALREVPFFFLSSTHWDDASELLAMELGATRYLRRPLEPEALLREIRSALQR